MFKEDYVSFETTKLLMDKEGFKKGLSKLLFMATKTEELSVDRIFEITDKITDDVLDLAYRFLNIN